MVLDYFLCMDFLPYVQPRLLIDFSSVHPTKTTVTAQISVRLKVAGLEEHLLNDEVVQFTVSNSQKSTVII